MINRVKKLIGAEEFYAVNSIYCKALMFSSPSLGLSLIIAPLGVLGGIYAKHYGVSLSVVASAMLLARLFDAFTDPVIGYFSDRIAVNSGSRKQLVLSGGILLIPCAYFLYAPPLGVSGFYFSFWYMALYLSLTLFNIPYQAWVNEFTLDSREKTLVFSLIGASNLLGGMLFYILPLLPYFLTTNITPDVLHVTILCGSIVLILGLLVLTKVESTSYQDVHSLVSERDSSVLSISNAARNLKSMVVDNKPFLHFFCSSMFLGVSVGIWSGMFFIYVDGYLKLGVVYSEVAVWGMFCGLLAIPVWYHLSLWLGNKSRVLLLGMLLLFLVYLVAGFLEPKSIGFQKLLLLNILMTFGAVSASVVQSPMLCDIIDYDRVKVNVERSGLYFSLLTLMSKIQMALGAALGLFIAGFFGFDMNADQQSSSAVMGLRLGVSWIPSMLVVMAMLFISLVSLDERRMKIIRRRLNSSAVGVRLEIREIRVR